VSAEPAAQPPPAAALPVAPLALTYDELPAGSDLRREYHDGGAVTITSPAGEPSAAVRRALAQRHAVAAAGLDGGLTAIALSVAWPLFARLDAVERGVALALLVVVSGGAFLLVWKAWYGNDLDLVAEARQETAILHADASRLLIETAGPRGERSFEIPAEDVEKIGVVGWRREELLIPHLKIDRARAPALQLLAGRHPVELDWVAATVRQALRRRAD
jgi:hypothetical protein